MRASERQNAVPVDISKMFLLKLQKNHFFVKIAKKYFSYCEKFFTFFILKFRNLKFPELETWDLELPRTWELRNLN